MDLKNIKIEDPFWGHMQELVTDVVIPFQEDVLNDRQPGVEKSHAIENFKIAAGLSQGEFYGMVFQDSDVAKWLEGVAYSLIIKPDAALEKRADDIIDIIAAAQQPDGYLNTYFTIKEPEHRWQNLLECHELYCAGHMMEAAVAYYEATGKDKLLKVMEGMAGHIIDRFGPDKLPGIPGHQEVEIGLMRMYHATGNEAYKKQARYFLEERGKNPAFFAEEAAKRDWNHFGMVPKDIKYNQSHATIYEQEEAVGHSVRMVTSLGRYAWDEDDDVIYSHLFIGQEARLKKADIKVVSEYPWKGHVSYSITPKTGDEFAVAIHIPGYLKSFEVTLNGMRLKENSEAKADVFYSYRDGYIYIKNKWHDNDVIEISFNMDIRVIYANTKVREDIGCAALQRGPVVYAFEGVDNDDDVQSLMIDVSRLNEAQIETEAEGTLKGAVLLDIPAVRLESSDALYSEKPPRQKSVIARAIPYYMWGNRGLNQMRVWMHTI